MRRALTSLLLGSLLPFSALAGNFMFPLPPKALKPTHIVLEPQVSEQDYFWLTEKYPSSLALEHYRRVLADWKECVLAPSAWVAFGDLSNGKDSFVHSRTAYWASRKNDAAVVVITKYESRGKAWRDKPDNDNQFVAVVKYVVPDAKKMLSTLKVSCESDT